MTERALSSKARSLGHWLIVAALAVGSANAAVFAWRGATRLARDTQGEREKATRRITALLHAHGVQQGEGVLLVPDGLSQRGADLDLLAFEMRIRHDAYPIRWRVIPVGSPGRQASLSPWELKTPGRPHVVVAYRVPFKAPAGWRVWTVGSASVALAKHGTSAGRGQTGFPGPSLLRVVLVVTGIAALIGMGAMVLGALGFPRYPWPVRLAMSHLVGTVCLASVATAALLAAGRLSVWMAYAAIGAAGFLWACRWRGWTDGTTGTGGTTGTDESDGGGLVWGVAAGAIAVGAVAALIQFAGCGLSWDGWSIWELKARAMFHDRTPSLLANALYDFSHRDYPPALPIHTWWLYAHFGSVAERLAQLGGLMFAADLAVLTYALASELVRPTRQSRVLPGGAGLAAAALVMTQPVVLRHASSGYADVPFAAFMLAAVWCAKTLARQPESRGQAAVVGLCVGGCLMTKNEGVPLALVMALVGVHWVFSGSGKGGRSIRWRALWTSSAMALLLVLPWSGLAVRLGLRGDLFGGGRYPVADAVRRGMTSSDADVRVPRTAVIAGAVLRSGAALGPAYPAWGFAWLAAVVGGASVLCTKRRDLYLPFAVGGALFAVYLLVLMRTPHPLEWHLSTSLDRLLLHILPLGVAVGCSALISPELRAPSGGQ